MAPTPPPRLMFGAVLVLLVVTFLPAGLGASHSWGPYHWRNTSANPVVLTVGDNVSPLWDGHLTDAVQDWDQSLVLDLSVVPGAANPRSCKPGTGTIEVCAASYGFKGWLGLARIWVSGVHITAASVQLNDTYLIDYAAVYGYDTPEWRQFVMCQELGHVVGLDHVDEDFENPNVGTCMDYTDNPAGGGSEPANTSPDAHDYAQLEAIYDHIDTSGGGRGNGARGFNPQPQAPPAFVRQGDWGDLVRSRGRVALFRLNLGNGNYVFTFVIRA